MKIVNNDTKKNKTNIIKLLTVKHGIIIVIITITIIKQQISLYSNFCSSDVEIACAAVMCDVAAGNVGIALATIIIEYSTTFHHAHVKENV
jgi:hypothetical protein